MNLNIIKKKLENEGYEMIMRPLYDYGECIQGGIPTDNENSSLNSYFRVMMINERIYLDLASQIMRNKYFDSEDSLVDYIKNLFPLK